jgi:thioredoxin 1
LRSKLIGYLALLTIFTFIFLSADCSQTFAQDKAGKATVQRPSVFKPLVTFVELGSVNCIPCKAMQPIMKAVEEEYKGQVRIVFHDVWTGKGKKDAEKYNIRVIPTQVFLDKDGKEFYRHEGFFPKEGVVEVIKMQGVK